MSKWYQLNIIYPGFSHKLYQNVQEAETELGGDKKKKNEHTHIK